ncbi:HupE/UreJ family protein [Lysobacter sp. MMG2]|uniref:HupE/UreJ family protein n=1 Tax=Lysobacter sp. MMG2 TaxID=2801338 RepID=UPI001C23A2B8|nr:HupE/UreJ family protein [Lysobacter sp. MMG2]MBU8977785.1 HupE/UreJ family protein [Lysobacter sp. MMG2]
MKRIPLRGLRWALLALLLLAWPLMADVFRPAYLELRETGNNSYDVLWKVPALGESLRAPSRIVFPPDTEEAGAAQTYAVPGAVIERRRIHRAGGLVGQTIRIEGVSGSITDVLARVERLDGSSQVERLMPDAPAFVVEAPAGALAVAKTYLVLGVEHILGGFDHLLFVLALLLIVRGGLRIVATVTAFTVAHSITLVAATLGWVHVPGPPLEATIALSIAFVAAEVVHGLRGNPGLTARAPWLVAFGFGLLHGLGFAGALAEVGLPQNAIPVALLMFNVGVEIGQLMFVTAVLLLLRFARLRRWALPRSAEVAMPYAIGSVAMFWVVERAGAFLG